MTPLIREACSLDRDVALACVWFDMGTLDRWGFDLAVQGMRLPFEKCGVVMICGNSGEAALMILTQADEDVILVSLHSLRSANRLPMYALYLGSKNELIAAKIEGEDDLPSKEKLGPSVGLVAEFLRATSKVGYRASPKASPTNARRAAKGKPPLSYSWHTVTIGPVDAKCDPKGGTHASPRQHQRRGHFRTLADGRRVWVRDCTVGDATLGTVWKDYRISLAA